MAGTDLAKVVTLQDGRVFPTMREIVEVSGNRHDYVLAGVRVILPNAGQPPENSGDSRNQMVSRWFWEYRYVADRGREYPAFDVTRQGLALHDEGAAPDGSERGRPIARTDLAKVVTLQDGRVLASTRDIAELFGKQHKNVIEAVRGILANAANSAENSAESQNQRVGGWFREYRYVDSTGRDLPAFEVTREGFSLLAMGFTGPKAQEFKVAMICRFEELEAAVRGGALAPFSVEQREVIGGIVKRVQGKAMREAEDRTLTRARDRRIEPRRVCRRLFGSNQAAIGMALSWA